MVWPALRDFLQVPDTLTGRGVRIAIIDGDFPFHPDITSNAQRHTLYVRVIEPHPQPIAFNATSGPWQGGAHGLWAAAAAGGSGMHSGGLYPGIAPGADLFLVADYLRGKPYDYEQNTIAALRWTWKHWRKYNIRGVLVATIGKHDSGLLPWQAEPQRVWCEALADAGLLVVAGSGNTTDLTAWVTHAAAPSVLSVGGIIIPEIGDLADAPPYHGGRGQTFEGKRIPEILAPAENLVLPYGMDEDLQSHFYATMDVLPRGYARTEGTSFAGPIVLGAAACVWQAHQEWPAWQMREALMQTAIQAPQWASLGAGTVSVSRAAGHTPSSRTSTRSDTPYARRRAWRKKRLAVRLKAAHLDTDNAVEALLSILPNALPVDQVDTMRRLLHHPSASIRAAALCLLATQPEMLTADDVLPSLKDVTVYVRVAALYTLGRCPHLWRTAILHLSETFGDQNLDVRFCAFRLAAKVKHLAFVEPLIAGLENDARQGHVANFAQRCEALTAITGVPTPPLSQWKLGECFYSERTCQDRLDIAEHWRTWLSMHQ